MSHGKTCGGFYQNVFMRCLIIIIINNIDITSLNVNSIRISKKYNKHVVYIFLVDSISGKNKIN